MKAPRSILVVVTRRIGDVLLATPVIRSLRRHWPDAKIDVLVFRGTEGVLAGNPDVRSVLTIAERPSGGAHLALATRLWRRYDLSISLVPSDRPTVYAWLAGHRSCGLVVNAPKHRWKQWLLNVAVDYDNRNTHTVNLYLRTLETLSVPAITEVVAARPEKDMLRIDGVLREAGVTGEFAVLHPSPKFPYKMWTQHGWCEAGRWLLGKGLQVILTGGSDADERAYVGNIAAAFPGALNLAGKISLAETACLLAQARLYIGPDTAVTHLAAAIGTPTIALFGPTDPVKWGPWPAAQRGRHNPWRRTGSQRAGNVLLLQGSGLCVPCLHEGCSRQINSLSDCLQHLPSSRIIAAADTLLKEPLMPRTQLNPHVH
jgi:heptosyltransferase-3